MKKTIRMFFILVAFVALLVGAYVGYLYLDYHRLEDNLALEVQNIDQAETYQVGQAYQMMTYNIGYGSYPADYSFFMDGGKEVRARSKAAVEEALAYDKSYIEEEDPDLVVMQEVDLKGDRSQKVNQVETLTQALPHYAWSFAQNYDSSYLFYPIMNPIGAAVSGLLTLSQVDFVQGTRYSLPIDTDINKFFDLDRAYSLYRFDTDQEADLVVINIHLSAYTENASIQKQQLEKLSQSMKEEYQAGNYVIVGGDFNHALAGQAREDLTWMKAFPIEYLPQGFSIQASANAPSVRHINEPYQAGHTLTGNVDGFLVSDNVQVDKVETLDKGFVASDHNPVILDFTLEKE